MDIRKTIKRVVEINDELDALQEQMKIREEETGIELTELENEWISYLMFELIKFSGNDCIRADGSIKTSVVEAFMDTLTGDEKIMMEHTFFKECDDDSNYISIVEIDFFLNPLFESVKSGEK